MTLPIPKGFRFAGIACGAKSDPTTKDLSLVVSDCAAVAAGVYTQNQVVAAPVELCRERTPTADARVVITNSGNANACTGKRGHADATAMCQLIAAALGGCEEAQVLVMSTGVIGRFLPMEQISTGIPQAAQALDSSEASFLDSADGILTTDQGRKVAARTLTIGGQTITILGMAKGAGMIGPNMATMLCTIVTDAALDPDSAQKVLQRVADRSFNSISVEGHTSTNDTMLLLANGQSGTPQLQGQELAEFETTLAELAIELAKLIPADGEGAAHLIEIRIRGAATDQDAHQFAKTVASSNLVKTAIYGNDPNWGRIISAAGYAGPDLDMARLQLTVNGFQLYLDGEPAEFDAGAASDSIRSNPQTTVELSVGEGPGESIHWTSDLTVEYVRFNAEYTT